ncbi:MAG: hypothetical protein K2G01_00755, partial [Paramuribaculum sp.]|nr:hypothetical protein [Paramuribaculum sp.]
SDVLVCILFFVINAAKKYGLCQFACKNATNYDITTPIRSKFPQRNMLKAENKCYEVLVYYK